MINNLYSRLQSTKTLINGFQFPSTTMPPKSISSLKNTILSNKPENRNVREREASRDLWRITDSSHRELETSPLFLDITTRLVGSSSSCC
ncbi:hypothetical protein CEXT_744491 [Caerostris extrusa]|uniref:Uncharacterized protein n=1 Tax=Caerostris extrusa TaxID=172846 RepID=A0AAV4MIV6_CAEEX|nr:hypothetical protein CEXT_744491 [Caerostris extrusa]